jgi:hypothetical protein
LDGFDTALLALAFKKLHGALVGLGIRPSFERAEVATLAGFGILLPGIEPVLAGF